MKHRNTILTALVAIAVISFSSCKIEETNPAKDITLGSAEIQVILEANLNTTNDTTENGSYQLNNERVEGVTVTATIDKRNFYATTSGNYEDEVVSGVSDANGTVTLEVPVGENANISYRVSVSDLLVEQRTSTSVNDLPEEKVASYNSTFNVTVNKGSKEIQKLTMSLN